MLKQLNRVMYSFELKTIYPTCISAARVSASIDYDINPCENFYDFACGMWMKRHVVPEDRSNLYTYGVLRDEVAITIKCKYQHTYYI